MSLHLPTNGSKWDERNDTLIALLSFIHDLQQIAVVHSNSEEVCLKLGCTLDLLHLSRIIKNKNIIITKWQLKRPVNIIKCKQKTCSLGSSHLALCVHACCTGLRDCKE